MKPAPSIREIIQLGNPRLREQSKKVSDFNSTVLKQLVADLLCTLQDASGVGIAAPQVSECVAVIIVASRPTKRYPDAPAMKPVVMINPSFSVMDSQREKDWEGCLSIPGIRAMVPRYKKIEAYYCNLEGKPLSMQMEGFVARVFQHEYDHLLGTVYLDRVEDNTDIITESEFLKRH